MKIRRREFIIGAGIAAATPGSSEARRLGATLAGGAPAAPHVPGGPFITAVTGTGFARTDGGGSIGWGVMFTVGATPLVLTDLGRLKITGNTQTHAMAAYWVHLPPEPHQYTIELVMGSQVTVNVPTGAVGQFVYAPVASDIVLWPGKTYMVASAEGAGDTWYDSSAMTVTTTSDATIINAIEIRSDMGWNNGASGTTYVPVNFRYTVGIPGSVAQAQGTVFSQFESGSFFNADVNGVSSGLITVGALQQYSPPQDGNTTYEWLVWNGSGAIAARSGPLTGVHPPPTGHKWCEWVFDTTTVPDGAYSIYPRFLDSNSESTIQLTPIGASTLIANHPPVSTGPQFVPSSPAQNHDNPGPRPDFIHYAGTPVPPNATYPLSYVHIPGSSSPAYRDASQWYAQCAGPRHDLYQHMVQFSTTPAPNHGVMVDYFTSLGGSSTQGSYNDVINQNPMSGTRLNMTYSPYTTFEEDPAGGGVWWGGEIIGRILKLHNDGTVETIVGYERDKTVLTYGTERNQAPTEDQITRNLIGTFPPDGSGGVHDLGGTNDLCFDPRNSDILYVVTQLDHWIAKVVISTKTVTIYAGQPGNNGYSGDGGPATSATFDNPSSIIMSDGTGNAGPAGTMYVADSFNGAIRKITPTGTISTICGGSLSPGPIPSLATVSASTDYTVSSFVWSGGTGGSGAIIMTTATNIGIGFTLNLAGGVNPGGINDPNGLYVVSAITDSQHFTVVVAPGFPAATHTPQPGNGTLTGSMTFTSQNADVYSASNTVPFSGSWFVFPYVIRFTSATNGTNIVLGEIQSQAIRLLNLSAQTAVRIGCHADFLESDGTLQWIWLSVNTGATCGPLDDIVSFKFQSTTHFDWRFELAARWIGHTGYSSIFASDTPGYVPSYGPLQSGIFAAFGHYPWGIAMSKTEGRIIGSGAGTMWATEAWISQGPPTNPLMNLDVNSWSSGALIQNYGTPAGFPLDVRPAFSALWGPVGYSVLLGMTFEDLMHGTYASTTPGDPGDVALATFIQNGMGGMVPRPELTGNDLRDFIYWVRRGTLQGSQGPTPVQPGAQNPDNNWPLFTALTVTRSSPTVIHAHWVTNKSTIGLVGAGSATQNGYTNYPIYTDIEPGFNTTHDMDLTVPSFISPLYVVVVAKDQAGNYTHTLPVAIT